MDETTFDQPYDLELAYGVPEISGDVLGIWNDPPKKIPFWKAMMAIWNYPFPELVHNATFVRTNVMWDCEFPYRAIFKVPVCHPDDPAYRLCPNFPEACVSQEGDVRWVCDIKQNLCHATTDGFGKYYLTRVPGRHHHQFVSHRQIIGDAWCSNLKNPYEMTAYLVSDRNYDAPTAKTLRRTTRWITGHYSSYNKGLFGIPVRFTEIIGANGDEGAQLNLDGILNGNAYPQNLIPEEAPGGYREIPDCRYVREGGPYGQILTTLDTNNIDWCWNFYWVMCLYDHTTEDIVAFTSLADIKRNTGFDAKTVRHMVKNIKLDSQRIFFRL